MSLVMVGSGYLGITIRPYLSVGLAYKAKTLCSEVFVAGRRLADVRPILLWTTYERSRLSGLVSTRSRECQPHDVWQQRVRLGLMVSSDARLHLGPQASRRTYGKCFRRQAMANLLGRGQPVHSS